jgi:hypothetical protein
MAVLMHRGSTGTAHATWVNGRGSRNAGHEGPAPRWLAIRRAFAHAIYIHIFSTRPSGCSPAVRNVDRSKSTREQELIQPTRLERKQREEVLSRYGPTVGFAGGRPLGTTSGAARTRDGSGGGGNRAGRALPSAANSTAVLATVATTPMISNRVFPSAS